MTKKPTPLVSPLAPARFPDLPPVAGVRFASANSGTKYKNRDDVMLAELAPGSTIAGVFTQSSTRAAPVLDCQKKIAGPSDGGAAFFVNAGNANAFTGARGDGSVEAITSATAQSLGISPARVFSSSTGVIGEPLPHKAIVAKLSEMKTALSDDAIAPAANAILTTDTFAKGAFTTIQGDGGKITIAGFAKGSGMIAPDMATMLVYIFTDAKVARPLLQDMVATATQSTFNCITVDSDTSTSDTLLVAATGQSSAAEITANDDNFRTALHGIMLDLAHQVIRDGEGATKFVQIRVTGASTDADARKIAMSVANSPLVKTAIAGEDPNWGRIVMAVGKSGAAADRDRLAISFGDILVAEKGWVSPSYTEQQGVAYMKNQDISINIDIGLGAGSAIVWTCDLTHGYIEINADYRS